jgi:glycerophosphoryl diester phosphodiesterase
MKTVITVFLMSWVTIVSGQNFYIAHRGASNEAPENTLASVKLAWEAGADAAEIDVHLASDNRIMVIHDKDTRRTCAGKSFIIKNTPSEVLRDLDAGSWKDPGFKGEKIPYLEEIIETIPEGKKLVVEIKCGSEIIPHLERVMAKTPKSAHVIFISFGWETILDIKKAFPGNPAYWLSSDKKNALKRIPEVAEAGLAGINMQYGSIDEELIAAAKKYNLEVLAWTVDQPEEAKRLHGLGVSYITTNRPDWLKQQLR